MEIIVREKDVVLKEGEQEIILEGDKLEALRFIAGLASREAFRISESNWDRLAGDLSAEEFAYMYNNTSW